MKKILSTFHFSLLTSALVLMCLAACQQKAVMPSQFTELEGEATIYPDYKGVVIPPNIAPLNFMLKDTLAIAVVAHLQGGGEELLAGGKGLTVTMDTTEWRALLQASKGKDISVSVYAQHPDGWVLYKAHTLTVAEEDIDSYLSYRLIEPGYELYRQLGLYQRNLTNWDVRPIYENNREFEDSENHCINCHNYRWGDARDMLFHVRANHGGTIIVQDGKAHKVQIKDSTILTSGVYPSWHPTENLIAFSTNKTGQTFHLYYKEKIEVMDEASDILLYDVSKNEVSHIFRSDYELETFPCWSPKGDRLYYCNADVERFIQPGTADSTRVMQLVYNYDSLRYNLMAVDFDIQKRTFSEPKMVVDAESMQKSITFPRVSPDGRYVLFALGDYGQFHIWHVSSDLWVKDLETDNCYSLTEANSPDVDSFHSWSTNGRWIAFSSRRMDGNYSRTFLAYFDKQGQAHKAFVLPQEDPEMNVLLLKSYNVPELTRNAVEIPVEDVRKCVLETEGENSRYIR